jgi:hypothetical protein
MELRSRKDSGVFIDGSGVETTTMKDEARDTKSGKADLQNRTDIRRKNRGEGDIPTRTQR